MQSIGRWRRIEEVVEQEKLWEKSGKDFQRRLRGAASHLGIANGTYMAEEHAKYIRYNLERTGNRLKVGKCVTAVAGGLLALTYQDESQNAAAGHLLNEVSNALDRAEKFYSASAEITTAKAANQVVTKWVNRVPCYANYALAVAAAWDVGQEYGKFIRMGFSSPASAQAYLESTKRFEANGGWTAVVGGLMCTVGLEKAGYQVGRFAEWGFVKDVVAPAFDEATKPAPGVDYVFQGLELRD